MSEALSKVTSTLFSRGLLAASCCAQVASLVGRWRGLAAISQDFIGTGSG